MNILYRKAPAARPGALTLVIILLSLILVPDNAFCQRKDTDAKWPRDNARKCRERKVLDEAGLRIRYAFNAEDIRDRNTWIDEGQLKIGKTMTNYSSYFEEDNEDSLAVWLNAHPNSNVWPPARWLRGHKPDHWIEYQYSNINIKGNTLEEWATMPFAIDNENLHYTETLPLQKWSITKDTMTVCGYPCIKATCRWRGRDYTAWFTTDIPVSCGPWKFGGLPGLIMKISDNDNIYSWEAVTVETGNFHIFAPRGRKYSESTREKVLKLQRELNENYFKTTGTTVIIYKTGQPLSSRMHPYTQLELE